MAKTISNSFNVNIVEDGESAPYYFQEWFAWSNDTTTASVTTAPTIDGSWQTSIPAKGSYAYLWRKSIRFVWQESSRTYTQETAQYFRMSGTDGTSIKTRGSVTDASKRSSSGTATLTNGSTITMSDGDAVTQLDDGHLYQWVTESGGSWLDLGQFKGENGKTYFTHIVFATNVNYSGSAVTSVEGYTPTKSPNDTTHFWMGTYVDETSADPTSGSDPILLSYTWSYTKGEDATLVTLVPNPSTANFAWSNGSYTPSTIKLTCGFVITEGDSNTSYTGSVSDYTTLYNKLQYRAYVRTKRSDGTYGNWVAWGISTAALNPTPSTTNIGYEFALSTATNTSSVSDSNIITRVVVPIVKSGEKGEQGEMSRNLYFAGLLSDVGGSTFDATDHKAPYVDVETGSSLLTPNCYMYVGANGTGITFPTTASAYSSSADWELMVSDFTYLITQAIFAKFAKLGSWIFNGDYMFSQHGIKNGQDSTNYEEFEGNETDAFQPNLYMNALTGRLVANDIVLRGVLNNMINNLTPSNYNKFGCLYNTDLYINPLKCGQYVEFEVDIQQLNLVLPSYAYGMQLPIKSEVENEDTMDIEYTYYTLNELRQMVGKSIMFMPKNQGLSAPILKSAVLFLRNYQYNDLSSVTTESGYYDLTRINELSFAASSQSFFIHAHCMTGVYNSRECIYWEVEAIAAVLESPVIVGITSDSTLYTTHTLELHNKLEEKVLDGNAENVVTQNNGYFYIDCPKELKPHIETYGGELNLTRLSQGNYLDSYVWRVANYTGERNLIVTFTENT